MDTTTLMIRIDDEVIMRPIAEGDVAAVLEAVQVNYDHLRPFMEWAKPDYGLTDVQSWIDHSITAAAKNEQLNFGLFRNGKFIGTIGFATFDHDAKVTEIGYWIDGLEQGKGITSLACKRLIDLAFDELGMKRIQIRCASGNERSAAIPIKFGFTKEGVQRRHVMRDGNIYDFWIFGLLREEWSG